MVKNTQGGSKTKSFARKSIINAHSSAHSSYVRMSTNPLEKYARVTKMYGNGRCQIITVDQLPLQCVIRNKFKGRSKRNCMIGIGTYLLVGLREWEHEYKTCDVLEIYSEEDVNTLKNNQSTCLHKLDGVIASQTTVRSDDDLIFTNEDENLKILETSEEYRTIDDKESSSSLASTRTGDFINIDDI